jgi:hypothetical protein
MSKGKGINEAFLAVNKELASNPKDPLLKRLLLEIIKQHQGLQ